MTGPDLSPPVAPGGQSSAQGALVAFWIARTEQRSVAMHRQLTRGQMIELSLRQAIVGDWRFRAARPGAWPLTVAK